MPIHHIILAYYKMPVNRADTQPAMAAIAELNDKSPRPLMPWWLQLRTPTDPDEGINHAW